MRDYLKPKIVFSKGVKISISFILLFLLYHTAEYMIMFKNNIPLFFTFQIIFFITAIILGKWYSGSGLAAWGLPFSKRIVTNIILGILLGVLLYSVPYCLALIFGIEKIIYFPSTPVLIKNSLPFAIGVLFTSLSEDILTRGLIFAHFKEKLKPVFLAILSASIYLLNHIYRLNGGLDVLLYIFLLGIIFIIPVLNSKNLWITGAMHWAGNLFFYISHDVIEVQEKDEFLGYNYLFSICILLMIPLIWVLTRKFKTATTI